MDTILVTGAARGFGLSLTKVFAEAGWTVFACARNAPDRDSLRELSDSSTHDVTPIRLDVTSQHDLYRARQLVRLETDTLDVLINNAGVNASTMDDPSKHVSLGSLEAEPILEMFHVNTVAPLIIVQAFHEFLAAGEESFVINVSSDRGSIANNEQPGNYSYSASKAALNMITKSLGNELKPDGVGVVSIDPGYLQTEMGGPNAIDDPMDAAADLESLLRTLSLEDSGSFLRLDEEPIAW